MKCSCKARNLKKFKEDEIIIFLVGVNESSRMLSTDPIFLTGTKFSQALLNMRGKTT
jgi:hypothetical protein